MWKANVTKSSFCVNYADFKMSFCFHTLGESCPVELSPPRVVVKHGDPASVTCNTSNTDVEGLGWEATQGGIGLTMTTSLTWTVTNVTDWDLNPACFINFKDGNQCLHSPDLVIYSKS